MKEFEFDDIVVSDENEVKKTSKKKKEDDSLYQKFSFDIDDVEDEKLKTSDIFKEEDIEPSINNFFEEKEDIIEEKPLFSSSNEEFDNPFKSVKPKEEKIEIEENIYEKANKDIKPIISFDEDEIENKEDALEEALSHTTKFTPFVEEKPNINTEDVEEAKEGKDSNGLIYLIVLFIILLAAIFIIPKIASLL